MIFGSFDGFAGDVDEGTPLLSAAISSRAIRHGVDLRGAAAEPPVTPAPLAAQPFSGCSVSRPRSRLAVRSDGQQTPASRQRGAHDMIRSQLSSIARSNRLDAKKRRRVLAARRPRRPERQGASELVAGAEQVLAALVVVVRQAVAVRIHPLVLELVGQVQRLERQVEAGVTDQDAEQSMFSVSAVPSTSLLLRPGTVVRYSSRYAADTRALKTSFSQYSVAL